MVKLFAKNAKLSILINEILTTNAINAFQIEAEFSKEWNDLADKYAVFYQVKGERYYVNFEKDETTVIIPAAVLKRELPVYVGLVGKKENYTKTTNYIKLSISEGANIENAKFAPYERDDDKETYVKTVKTKIKYIRLNDNNVFEYSVDKVNWQELKGGGGSGVSSYKDLTDKPKLNGIEIDGDKTPEDYNIPITEIQAAVEQTAADLTEANEKIAANAGSIAANTSDIAAVDESKVDKTTYNAFVASTNATITQLQNAVKDGIVFKGRYDDDFPAKPENPKNGWLIFSNKKEYIYSETDSAWIELGDEGSHLTKAIADGYYVAKNDNILAGKKPKISYDEKGLVTGGEDLAASDIPELPASKVTSGKFSDDRIENAEKWNKKYDKPANGIPKTDLASDVKSSLEKADTALQSAPVNSVNGKTGAVELGAQDVGALPANTPYVSSVNGKSGAVTGLATSADVAKKQNALSDAQLKAANSGITAEKVQKYDGYQTEIEGKASTNQSNEFTEAQFFNKGGKLFTTSDSNFTVYNFEGTPILTISDRTIDIAEEIATFTIGGKTPQGYAPLFVSEEGWLYFETSPTFHVSHSMQFEFSIYDDDLGSDIIKVTAGQVDFDPDGEDINLRIGGNYGLDGQIIKCLDQSPRWAYEDVTSSSLYFNNSSAFMVFDTGVYGVYEFFGVVTNGGGDTPFKIKFFTKSAFAVNRTFTMNGTETREFSVRIVRTKNSHGLQITPCSYVVKVNGETVLYGVFDDVANDIMYLTLGSSEFSYDFDGVQRLTRI